MEMFWVNVSLTEIFVDFSAAGPPGLSF